MVPGGTANTQLGEFFFLPVGKCQDTTRGIQSFRDAITDGSKASSCTLTAYQKTGCSGASVAYKPNVEANGESNVFILQVERLLFGNRLYEATE